MCEDLVIATNGPYLRVVLPDLELDWLAVRRAVDFELEEGIGRAEVIAPCYPDEDEVAGVRELVEHLERSGVETIMEWQGVPPADAGATPVTVPRSSHRAPQGRLEYTGSRSEAPLPIQKEERWN